MTGLAAPRGLQAGDHTIDSVVGPISFRLMWVDEQFMPGWYYYSLDGSSQPDQPTGPFGTIEAAYEDAAIELLFEAIPSVTTTTSITKGL